MRYHSAALDNSHSRGLVEVVYITSGEMTIYYKVVFVTAIEINETLGHHCYHDI